MSWFEYLAEPDKLDKNIEKLTEIERLQLIKEFVYEAIQYERRTFDTNGSVGGETIVEQLQKPQILYKLALKCLASVRYDLNLVHNWEMPICIVGTLLRQFIKMTTGATNADDENPMKDADWPGWIDGAARFSQLLYMFWTLIEGLDRVLVKPVRRCLTPPLPGLTIIPQAVFVEDNLLEEKQIHQRLEGCANILNCTLMMMEENCPNVKFAIPMFNSFKISVENDKSHIDLSKCVNIKSDVIFGNVGFFLGRHCFQRKEFDRAYQHFKNASLNYDSSLNSLCFFGLNKSLLESYSTLCKKLSIKQHHSRFQSPVVVLEAQLSNTQAINCEIIADILLEDTLLLLQRNLQKPCHISEQLRKRVESKIRSEKASAWYRVSTACILHRVCQGTASLSRFLSDIGQLESHQDVALVIQDILMNTGRLLNVTRRNNDDARENIKCFLLFLAHNLPVKFKFCQAFMSNTELVQLFNPNDSDLLTIKNLSSYSDELDCLQDEVAMLDSCHLDNHQKLEYDWFSISIDREDETCSTLMAGDQPKPTTNSESLKLVHSYDSEELKDILLSMNKTRPGLFSSRRWISSLCEDFWWIPRELEQILDIICCSVNPNVSLNNNNASNAAILDFECAYVYVLCVKAFLLRDKLHSWDLARQLLEVARSRVGIINSSLNSMQQIKGNMLSRCLEREILHCDLVKFLLTFEPTSPYNQKRSSVKTDEEKTVPLQLNESSLALHHELYMRAKNQLTNPQLNSSPLPSIYLQISCVCTILTLSKDPSVDLQVSSHPYSTPRNSIGNNTTSNSITNLLSSSPVIQLARLLVTVVKDCSFHSNQSAVSTDNSNSIPAKFIKSARELFDMLLNYVMNNNSESNDTNMNPINPANSKDNTTIQAASVKMEWHDLCLFTNLLASSSHLDILLSALISILSCHRSDINMSRPLYPRDIWPTTISSQLNCDSNNDSESSSTSSARLNEIVHDTLTQALSLNPLHSHWLFVRADLAMADGDWFLGMRMFLEAGAADTDFFTRPLDVSGPNGAPVYSDWSIRQMIRASRESGYIHQAIFLCQYLTIQSQVCPPANGDGTSSVTNPGNSNSDSISAAVSLAAQIATSSCATISLDSPDLYLSLIWLPDLLEVIGGIYLEQGAMEGHKRCVEALMTHPAVNTNNDPSIVMDAVTRKQLEFLRLLAMRYLMR